jgi:AmmeMemoRadiSam system protein B
MLGTGHSLQEHYFSVSEKAFGSPLGEVRNARDWARAVKHEGGAAVCPDDFVHRSEHSLEFQLLFCQHLFGNDFRLLPLLCGSFHGLLDSVSRPSEVREIGAVIEVLKRAAGSEPRTLVIAGVDLSHIGPKFGHDRSAAALAPEARAHDRTLLQSLERGDIDGFWAESRRVRDRYHVCGLSSLACLMELMPGRPGHVLDYELWHEEATRSAVGFAAAVLTEAAPEGDPGAGHE